MQYLGSLLAAYSVVWTGICLYLIRLTRQTRRLEDELDAVRRATSSK